jgi:hypothetical protein
MVQLGVQNGITEGALEEREVIPAWRGVSGRSRAGGAAGACARPDAALGWGTRAEPRSLWRVVVSVDPNNWLRLRMV